MVDRIDRLVQEFAGPFLTGDRFFLVPLVHIDRVEVVQLFVAPDRIHIRIQAAAGFDSVLAERVALPFGQRLHDLGRLLVHIFQRETDPSFAPAQVVVQTGSREHEKRCRDTPQL